MKKIIILLLLFIISPIAALAQSSNPCTNADNIQSVAVSIATIATTRIINNADAEKKTILCNVSLTLVGAATANTIVIEYGTGAACGTGTTVLSGAFTASVVVGSSTVLRLPPYSIKSVPAGNSTCLVTTTGDAVKGVVSFVVQ